MRFWSLRVEPGLSPSCHSHLPFPPLLVSRGSESLTLLPHPGITPHSSCLSLSRSRGPVPIPADTDPWVGVRGSCLVGVRILINPFCAVQSPGWKASSDGLPARTERPRGALRACLGCRAVAWAQEGPGGFCPGGTGVCRARGHHPGPCPQTHVLRTIVIIDPSFFCCCEARI